MKKVMVLVVAALSLMGSISLAKSEKEVDRSPNQVVNYGKKVTAGGFMISEFGDAGGTVLGVFGEAAAKIYLGMTEPFVEKVFDYQCLDKNAKIIKAKLLQRYGISFGCQQYPAQCGETGEVSYRCESHLNYKDGSLKARLINN